MSQDGPETGDASSALAVREDVPQQSAIDEGMASTFDFGLVLAFGIVFLALCALFAVSMHRSQPAIAPVAQITFAPVQVTTPAPSPQALRGEALGYWEPAIAQAGVANAMVKSARSDFTAGGGGRALHDVALGQVAARNAFEAAAADPPGEEAWSTIQSDLVDGIGIQRDALAMARTAVQSGSQAEFDRAENAAANARKIIGFATRDARAWYAAHGGNPAAIRDIDGNALLPLKNAERPATGA